MTEPPIPPQTEDDLLAAEYVLGVLDLSERTAVETRLRNDAVFAALVARWEDHFAGFNEGYADTPAPDLLPQIEARLFPTATAPRRRLWGNLWAWGTTAAAALAVVAYLALSPASPSLVATLTADAGPLQFQAVITQDRLTLTRISGDPADGRHSHELWLIVGDNPPVSLGLIDEAQESLSLPGVAPGAVLAITQEEPGGSPDGQPHGPILVKGVLNAA